jgi:hypothetical protein
MIKNSKQARIIINTCLDLEKLSTEVRYKK